MKFWDTSALVPLLIREGTSDSVLRIIQEDPEMAVWWGTETECLSALARREREKQLNHRDIAAAERDLNQIMAGALEILPSQELRRHARRLLMTHPLRAADSLQLAAAMILAGDQPSQVTIITFDQNLVACAQREGFITLSE
jgi:predicted nucleic acid-binding protein